jgi:proline iminopeptidase
MNKIITFLIITFTFNNSFCQPAYLQTFGKKEDKAVIFLHGGPGYNSANFESTTAQNLANKGFFVIVYDRKGEGRSEDKSAKFTFQESFDDIKSIYNKYELTEAILIGHGFGGIIASLFTEKYPEKVNALVLVSTPISMQEYYRTIIRSSKLIYESNKDTVNLKLLKEVEKMDTTSLQYTSACFNHNIINRLNSLSNPTDEARKIYEKFRNDSVNIKFVYQYSYEAPQGFLNNEKYSSINIADNLKKIIAAKKKVFAFYGKEDGTISSSEIGKLKTIIGAANVNYMDACSYNVFIDRQSDFLESISKLLQ